jgi:rod shape-determining protein MreD
VIRAIRLALLLVAVVLLQTAVLPHLRIGGVAPEIGLVVTVGVAFTAGPSAGAIFGFAAGLALDLFLSTPLGLSALAWSLTGYAVGVLQGAVLRASWWFPIALTFVAGVVGGLLFCVVGAIVGQGQLWGFSALRTVLGSALYGALLAPIVFPVVRFALHAEGPRSARPLGGQGW